MERGRKGRREGKPTSPTPQLPTGRTHNHPPGLSIPGAAPLLHLKYHRVASLAFPMVSSGLFRDKEKQIKTKRETDEERETGETKRDRRRDKER